MPVLVLKPLGATINRFESSFYICVALTEGMTFPMPYLVTITAVSLHFVPSCFILYNQLL